MNHDVGIGLAMVSEMNFWEPVEVGVGVGVGVGEVPPYGFTLPSIWPNMNGTPGKNPALPPQGYDTL